MRVAFIPADVDATAAYRLRFPLEAAPDLEPVEFPVLDETTSPDGGRFVLYDAASPPEADVYVLQRPSSVDSLDTIGFLKRETGKPVVIELDDNFLNVPPWNLSFTRLHPDWRVRARDWADRHPDDPNVQKGRISADRLKEIALATKTVNWNIVNQAVSKADALTVSTPALAAAYRRFNKNVHVLPNFVRWSDWAGLTPFPADPFARFRIGYLGHADWHSRDVMLLQGLLGPWLDWHPDVFFVAAGDERVHDIVGVPVAQRLTVPWARFPGHVNMMQFHLGLVPLCSHPFNESKSWLKGLEYNAAGVPFLASNTEPYRELVARGAAGHTAAKPTQWKRLLDRAYATYKAGGWADRQLHARTFARGHSIERHARRWGKAYDTILREAA